MPRPKHHRHDGAEATGPGSREPERGPRPVEGSGELATLSASRQERQAVGLVAHTCHYSARPFICSGRALSLPRLDRRKRINLAEYATGRGYLRDRPQPTRGGGCQSIKVRCARTASIRSSSKRATRADQTVDRAESLRASSLLVRHPILVSLDMLHAGLQ